MVASPETRLRALYLLEDNRFNISNVGRRNLREESHFRWEELRISSETTAIPAEIYCRCPMAGMSMSLNNKKGLQFKIPCQAAGGDKK